MNTIDFLLAGLIMLLAFIIIVNITTPYKEYFTNSPTDSMTYSPTDSMTNSPTDSMTYSPTDSVTDADPYLDTDSSTDATIYRKYKVVNTDNSYKLVSTEKIEKDEKIGLAFIRVIVDKQIVVNSAFAIYVTHNVNSNSKILQINDNINENYYVVAKDQILPDEEITINFYSPDFPDFIDTSRRTLNIYK